MCPIFDKEHRKLITQRVNALRQTIRIMEARLPTKPSEEVLAQEKLIEADRKLIEKQNVLLETMAKALLKRLSKKRK